ncbi:MAG: bifunctional oligoribonuclease/PAP phosphatase NrnA [Ignavibacteriae bacterium]|nr:bifunctional oligoribonuclease/PAP phosphatase NrnA [Ignavibacteriota bacterium]
MLNHSHLFESLNKFSSFIITTHVNPDPDAIGSEIAIAEILKQLNKKFKIINRSETPYNIKFLDSENFIEVFNEVNHKSVFEDYEAAIVLDLNHLNRTSIMENSFRNFKGKIICIDHHTNPENFTDLKFIDEIKSSTGEIIYDFINFNKNLKMNFQIALSLYSAIMTDTGSFRFSKTNSELHRKVAELLEFGINTEEVYDKIYSQYEFSRNKMLGNTLATISISESGKVSYMIITQAVLKDANGIEADVDGFVNFALNTKGVKIGILFFELENGIKISYRSKEKIPVNILAEKFKGGGHLNAAGSRLYNEKLDNIIPQVIEEAEKLIQNFEINLANNL